MFRNNNKSSNKILSNLFKMKILYEATLLLCCAIVIFFATVSGVLILLLWRHELFFGVNTRLVVLLCIMIVIVFSVGFVGTIAESSRALVLYAALLALFPLSIILVEIILRLWASPATVVKSNSPISELSGINNSQMTTQISSTAAAASSDATKQSAFTPPLTYPSLSYPLPTTVSISSWNNSWGIVPDSSFTTELPLSTQFYQLFREYKAPSPTSGPRTTHLKASEAARNLWKEFFITADSTKEGNSHTLDKIATGSGTFSLIPGSSIESILLMALAFLLVQIAIAHLLAAEIRRLRALENQSNISDEDVVNYDDKNELFQLDHDSIMIEQFHPAESENVELVDPSASSSGTTATLKGTTTMECCLVTFQPEVHYVPTAEAEVASSAIDSEATLLTTLQHHTHHHSTADNKQPRVHFHSSPQYFGDTPIDEFNNTTTSQTEVFSGTFQTSNPNTTQIIIPTIHSTASFSAPKTPTTTTSVKSSFPETEMILTPRKGCT